MRIQEESKFVAAYKQETAESYLLKCIDLIDARNILSPINIIEALSIQGMKLSLITPYLKSKILALDEEHKQNDLLFNKYYEDCKETQKEIDSLEDVVIFQSTTCAKCRQPLSAPSVHFFCKHSYHKR